MTAHPRTWQAVRDAVLARIRARDWPPGALIPPEAELAAEFGCARATVNRALRELAETGLIDRRRKAGTRVAETPVRRAVLSIPILREEIEATGQRHSYRLLEQRILPPPPALAARLGTQDRPALHLRALHMAGPAPFVIEERWINLDTVPAAATAPFGQQSANEWLVRHAPYSHATLSVTATEAGPDEAALLACPPGRALLRIERATFDGPHPITLAWLSYRPGYLLATTL